MIRILQGDCRAALASGDGPIITSSRPDGRFKKGERRSPATELKKGQHWRKPKPHWDRAWLEREYIERGRSAAEIATEAGCTSPAIVFWLKKHDIKRRSISGARALKYWGSKGERNSQFGKRGHLSSRFNGGLTPERQREYARSETREFLQSIRRRDDFRCRRCGKRNPGGPRDLHVHHIHSWSVYPNLRLDPSNAITLCRKCHLWVHSRANVERDYLKGDTKLRADIGMFGDIRMGA